MSEAPQCQHIKTNGTQCGSPALKDQQFCYYHRRCHPVTFQYGRHHANYSLSDITLPVFEDAYSLQITLHRITELILRHQIEPKDASLVLYALQIASSNLRRLEREAPKPEDLVTDPPVDPPAETESTDDDLPPGTIHASISTLDNEEFHFGKLTNIVITALPT